MRFTISKSSFVKHLTSLVSVVEKKTTVPMLSNVLIENKGEHWLTLTATDLDVTLKVDCEAEVSEPGAIALPARKLTDIVKSVEGDIQVETDAKFWCALKCGASRFKLAGLEKEHFPETPKTNGQALALAAKHLNGLIKRTSFAVCVEESRYALGGVQLYISSETLRMVATNGHRLSLASVPNTTGPETPIDVLIPRKALSEIERLTADGDTDVIFSMDSNHLFFQRGDRLLIVRVMVGNFPEFDRVIPQNNDKHVEIQTDALAAAVRRVALMSDERSRGIKFEVNGEGLTISASTPDLGESHDRLLVSYAGDPCVVGFNASYVLDVLEQIGERVSLAMKDEQSPVLLKPVETDTFEYVNVIMPMRLL